MERDLVRISVVLIRRIGGDIVDANQSILTIRRTTGGIDMILRRDVDNVRLANEGGDNPQGQLMDWGEGVYKLQVGSKVVVAYGGATRSEKSRVGEPLVPGEADVASQSPNDGGESRETDAEDSSRPKPQIDGEDVAQSAVETKTANIEASNEPKSDVAESGLLQIEVLSDPVKLADEDPGGALRGPACPSSRLAPPSIRGAAFPRRSAQRNHPCSEGCLHSRRVSPDATCLILACHAPLP